MSLDRLYSLATPGIRHTITESPFRSYPDLQDTGDGRPPASQSVSIRSGPPGRYCCISPSSSSSITNHDLSLIILTLASPSSVQALGCRYKQMKFYIDADSKINREQTKVIFRRSFFLLVLLSNMHFSVSKMLH